MTAPIVIVGIGELAGPFSHGFLRLGRPVYPVLRDTDAAARASQVMGPALTLITVREADLDATLDMLPAPWRSRVALVQNDLVPADWSRHRLLTPTVAVVWFEKKPGRAVKVIQPTLIGGPVASLMVEALGAVDIPATEVSDAALLDALIAKNLYIGVANIAGLAAPQGTTVGELWSEHRELAESVAADILDIQAGLTGLTLDRGSLIADMVSSFAADPDHGATGRTAPQRLARALGQGAEMGLACEALHRVNDSA